MVKTINYQNENLLELKVSFLPQDIVDITQISYDKDGKVNEHGTVIISKWALDLILKDRDASLHRSKSQ